MENQEGQPHKRLCNICNVELIEEYKSKLSSRVAESLGQAAIKMENDG